MGFVFSVGSCHFKLSQCNCLVQCSFILEHFCGSYTGRKSLCFTSSDRCPSHFCGFVKCSGFLVVSRYLMQTYSYPDVSHLQDTLPSEFFSCSHSQCTKRAYIKRCLPCMATLFSCLFFGNKSSGSWIVHILLCII